MMKIARLSLTMIVATFLCLSLFVTLSTAAQQMGEQKAKGGLFVNLTTDDTWAATKAIMFAHKKVLKNGYKPVAIWLNVRGVYLADKKRPSHTHGLMKEKGQTVQDMLKAFVKDGGTLIACQACSKAAGLKKEDYIDGITMGSEELVQGLLFDPKVKTLSW